MLGVQDSTETSALRDSPWLKKQMAQSRRVKILAVTAIVVVVAAVIGIAAGVTVSKKHKSQNLSSSGGASSGASGGSNGASSTTTSGPAAPDPNDPSNFEKDPNLHNAFYGIAYTPNGAILPDCGANQSDVIKDIQLLSQITTRIRLYGADCNVSALVLNAIKLTKVDMQVFLGNYIDYGDQTEYDRQKATILQAIQDYGADNIAGVTVGNEAMLNYCEEHQITDANDPAVTPAANFIVACIQDTRNAIQALGLSKNIPIGNSDAGDFFNNLVLEAIDFGLANVHPWFAHTTAAGGASWTFEFFQDTNIAGAAATTRKPDMYIAETGWPTGSKTPDTLNDGAGGPGGDASIANLQIYLDTFVCQANANDTKYFYFEFMDEPWKNITYGGVEGYWGIFDQNKKLKQGITLPTCSHP